MGYNYKWQTFIITILAFIFGIMLGYMGKEKIDSYQGIKKSEISGTIIINNLPYELKEKEK
jgi:hypothetical protein